MSTSELTPPATAHKRITDKQKREIIAAVAQGEPKTAVAQRLNIHRNTVNAICRDVQGLPKQGVKHLEEWRSTLDSGSFEAIEASVKDRTDPHRAATTGLNWLKGSGVLAPDNLGTGNVATVVSSIPEEWRSRYVSTPHEDQTPLDVVNVDPLTVQSKLSD